MTWFKELLMKVAAFVAAFFVGYQEAQKQEAEKDAEHYKKEAQKFADVDHSKPTFQRLRELAAKRKDNP